MASKFTGYILALKGQPSQKLGILQPLKSSQKLAPVRLEPAPVLQPMKPRQLSARYVESERASAHHRYFRAEHGREFPAWVAFQMNRPRRKQPKTAYTRRVAA